MTPSPIKETIDRWTEIRLEDGTVLRLKPVVSNVMRVEGERDDEGNPMYAVKITNVLVVAQISEKPEPYG